jgi:hypothetical protein
MGQAPTYLLVFALTGAALALSSCGGSDAQLLPGETARQITDNLDKVRELADEGDCVGAESAAEEVGEQIEALQGVDPKLKGALHDGAIRLNEVIGECEETTTETTPTEVPAEPEGEEKPKQGKEKAEKEEPEKEPPAVGNPHGAPPGQTTEPEPEAPEGAEGEPGEEGEGAEEAPSGGVGPASPVEGK